MNRRKAPRRARAAIRRSKQKQPGARRGWSRAGRAPAKADLLRTHSEWERIFDALPDVIFILDTNHRIVRANKATAERVGLTLNQIVGQTCFSCVHGTASPLPECPHSALLADGKEHFAEIFEKRLWGYFAVSVTPLYGAEGQVIGSVHVARDITEHKRAEEALQQANLVVENSPVVLFRWRAEAGWPVELVSQNVVQFGYLPEELLSGAIPYVALVHPEDLERVAREVQEYSADGVDQFQQEYRIIAKDGRIRWVDDRTVIERDEAGRITHYQGIVIDITERKETERRLLYLSTHDVLTGLYNRAFFEEEIARLERGREFPVSIIVIDVNGMKATNDTLGHAAGDDLLRRAAQVFQTTFRAEDIVARIGGDEFAALLPNTDAPATAEALTRLRQHVAAYSRAHPGTPLSLALGTATCRRGEILTEALKEADKQMYLDKSSLRNGGRAMDSVQ